MDLAELKFVVITDDLEKASKEIAKLGTEVSKLNKPMQDLTKQSARTNKELSKAEEAANKAALSQVKLEQAQTKSTKAAGKSISVLERQNLILQYQAEGNSKGQASILATAKAAGALDDEMLALNKTLVQQRTLIGGDPFDNSIGLHQKLQNQTKVTDEVTELFNKSLGLTEKQMVDLAREKQRLIALYGIEGKSLNNLSAEYDELIKKSVEINKANDARTNSMKQQIKIQNDAARANTYIANELERVNRLTESNGDITSATNNRLIRFEKELRASGRTAAQVAKELDAYRASLLATQKAAGNRQIDYLSRALGPQITDIGVGLATGQAPLTILLQQGGQLRDQFALAGVAGSEMGKMLVQASKAMVTSIKDIGLAVGQLITGAITGTGKAIIDGVVAPFKRLSESREALKQLDEGLISTTRYMRLMEVANGRMIQSMMAFGKVTAALGAVALIAVAVALKEVIAQESALSKAVNLTGGSLGLTTDSALALSKELAGSKGNVGSYVTAITEIAKAGNITSDNLKTVATTIVEVSKITGISADTLAKNFSKISEKPLEGLIPFAKELGTINVEILKQIQALEKAGKQTEAAKLATDAYAKALKDAAGTIREDMGVIETIFYGVGSAAKSMWDSILNIGRKGDLQSQMTDAVASLVEAQKGKSWYSRFGRTNEEEVEYYKEIVQSIGKQINAQKELGDVKAKNAADATKLEKSLKDKAAAGTGTKADKSQKDFENELNRARDFYDKQIAAVEELTKSEYALREARKSAGYKAGSPEGQQEIEQFYKRAEANELLVKSQKEARDELERQQKISADVVKLRNEMVQAGAKEVDNAKITTKALTDELEMYDYKLSLVGLEEKEVEKLLAQKKIQIEYEKEIARIRSLNLLPSAKEELELEEYKKFLIKREILDKDANLKSVIDLQKQYDSFKSGIADSITSALFEGGKSGSKKIRDIIIAELKKPITIIVNALVDATLGGFTGGTGGGAGGSFINSIVGSFLKDTIGSIAVGGTTLGAASTSFIAGLKAGMTGMSSATASSAGAAAGAGAAAAPVVGAVGGMVANRVISGDYSTGKNSQVIQDIATIAATMVFGPIGGLVTGAVSGVFNRAFGMKAKEITGQGIVGVLSAQGADVKSFEDWFQKGGWFRSNKSGRNLAAVSSSLQEYLDVSLFSVTASTKAYAVALGLEAKDIDGVTKAIDINLKGLSAEDRQKKIDEALGGFGDELAKKLGYESFAALQKLGEEVLQERYNLETQLLELQGNTTLLRARERDQIYETNKVLYDQINALKDKQKADEAAAEAMQKLTSITTTIVDEINRLRGINTSGTDLESQFAILTAQARSGDLNALAQLPEITKGLEQIAASTAVNATDIIFARARLAQSLQDTLGYTGGFTASATTSMASIGSVSASGATVSSNVTSASSNQELLAAMVIELQGLRAEVRADVSHNAKTAKILERANQDGETLSVSATIDGGVV